jgi:hypothetical protein
MESDHNWSDCAQTCFSVLKTMTASDCVTSTVVSLSSLLQRPPQNIKSLSRCPCCWSCNINTAISDWKVLLPKSLICLGKTFPQPLLFWHDTCIHSMHVNNRAWPIAYHNASTPALLAVWGFRLGFCTALWDISWCTKGYTNQFDLIDK